MVDVMLTSFLFTKVWVEGLAVCATTHSEQAAGSYSYKCGEILHDKLDHLMRSLNIVEMYVQSSLESRKEISSNECFPTLAAFMSIPALARSLGRHVEFVLLHFQISCSHSQQSRIAAALFRALTSCD